MIKKKKHLSSTQIVLIGFLCVILAGSLLLSLPISSSTGEAVSFVDALFTATTATCVTGLVTLPTAATWSLFGQVVILILIQIGGLGVITIGAGIMIMLHRKIEVDKRILISDSFNMNSLSGVVRFVKKVVLVTFAIELIGALLYMTVFVPKFGFKGVWISLFTSVSAFCNAGIDIIGENSLCDYARNPIINIVTMVLIILGGIGFIVWWDVEKIIKNKKCRHPKYLSLHSKIVLSVTALLIVTGAVLIFAFEYNNPLTIQNYSIGEKLMVSLFQSVTTRTAGFATIAQENLTSPSAFVSMLLMFVGGSPVGTAGGIKTATLFVLIVSTIAVVKNKRTIDVFNRQISTDAVRKSVAVFMMLLSVAIISSLLMLIFAGGELLNVLYETLSATATVGLTRNYTATLNTAGKLIIAATMYLGRVGPISLAFAFSANKKKENIIINPPEEIKIG